MSVHVRSASRPERSPGALASVSVVVPVFNSARTLPLLAARLADALPRVASGFEVVLVNDGSADESWRMIGELAERYPWIRGIDLARNFGQHNATLCGVRHARFEYLVTMDDDLEHPPEMIGALLGALREGEVAYGTAPSPPRGWARGVGRALLRPLLLRPLGTDGVRGATAFRAFRTGVRDGFPRDTGGVVCLDVFLARGGGRIRYVPVELGRRGSGRSGYSVAGLAASSLRLLAQESRAPLVGAGIGVMILGALAVAGVVDGSLYEGAAARPSTRGMVLAGLLAASQAAFFALHRLRRPQPPFVVRAEVHRG